MNTIDTTVADKNKEELLKLLEYAQGGDKISEENLILKIKSQYMNKCISRYLGRNRQVENEDLKQEFLIGVALSIKKCRLDIGDPIEYLVSQGIFKVRTCLRSKITTNTIQVCLECGYITRLHMVDNHYICRKCGSMNIETSEVCKHDDIVLENTEDDALLTEDKIISKIIIEKFEMTLTDGTNVKNLYNLIKMGVNRDNALISNFTKEIARIWGGCSEQNVVQTLHKLQDKLNKFANDNGYTIKNNRFVER